MNNQYQIFDSEDKDLYVGVSSNYFKVSEAKEIFRKLINSEVQDNSILIEIAKSGAKEVEAVVSFGVEEGEQFALALLNICNLIKR